MSQVHRPRIASEVDSERAADRMLRRFQDVREFSAHLCEPLEPEDCVIQSMPDVSPIRWHLAHTTWFFETFVLLPHFTGYDRQHDEYAMLFNSYYNSVGRQFPRHRRGLLSRPTLNQIWQYRAVVDRCCAQLLEELDEPSLQQVLPLLELGLQHEQQHQELMVTDIKHVFSCNPLYPIYRTLEDGTRAASSSDVEFVAFPRQLAEFGHSGDGFAFDNELPRHERLILPFELANRLVTNGEYLEFIADDGYRRPELWLSLGWNAVEQQHWTCPLYWQLQDAGWVEFSLSGIAPLDLDRPVCHVSYFEADAYARWRDCRLPTEFEWELAASSVPICGNFVEDCRLQPEYAARDSSELRQLWGDTWEWTNSSYSAYPGYRPDPGALGEYNGKFMCNQFVLRGGSCATSRDHLRATYRNFFPPDARWQFSGIRLGRDQ